ncbi:MAG: hypothetical protein IKO41_07855 [Lachnospiraceae bacterium]|nr:hypothetical protein [Lachnospiraceae bacterium]
MKYDKNGKPEILHDLSSLRGGLDGDGFDWDSVPSAVKKAIDDFVEEGFNGVLGGDAPADYEDYGAIRLSINAFAKSDEFNYDTEAIMRDYLAHTKKNPFTQEVFSSHERHFYGDHEMFASSSVFSIIYDMMICEAKSEYGGYAHRLFLYCFKTYRPDLYKRLKRYNAITRADAFDIAGNLEDAGQLYVDVALVLVAARFMGIRLGEGIGKLSVELTAKTQEIEETIDNAIQISSLQAKLVDEVVADMEAAGFEEVTEGREDALSYLQAAEEYHGIPYNAIAMFGRLDMTRAMAIADAIEDFPDKWLGGLEKNLLYVIDGLVELIARMRNDHADSLEPFFVGLDEKPIKFDPAKIMSAVPIPGAPKVQQKPEEKAGEEVSAVSREDRSADAATQLAPLISRIHSLEGEIVDLKQKAAGRARQEKEIERLRDLVQAQADELSALRTFAYNSTAEDEARETINLESAKSFLAAKRIAVIGGHPNWIAKLKNEVGDGWKFIKPSPSGTVDANFIIGMDFVFFFTDTLSHATYGKYVKACREHGVRFGYLHGVNVEGTIRQAYAVMNSAK